jgi:hypothetical protein
MNDNVNHPKHYNSHPSGVECIEITEHMNFCLGNAVKYCFRGGNKVSSEEIQDLQKGVWYAKREMESFPERYSVRNEHFGSLSNGRKREDQEACSDQEWVYDLYVFFTEKTSLCPCDGIGNFCWSAPTEFGRVTFRRKQTKQQSVQFNLGEHVEQYKKKESAQHGTVGSGEMVSKADDGTSDRDQTEQRISRSCGEKIQHIKSAGVEDTLWKKLAAFINHETNINRAAAIFYLAAHNNEIYRLRKARWYIDREISRILNEKSHEA